MKGYNYVREIVIKIMSAIKRLTRSLHAYDLLPHKHKEPPSQKTLPIWDYAYMWRSQRSEEEARGVAEIGSAIRRLRLSKKYSRDEFAKLLGIDPTLLVLIEIGEGDLETAQALLVQVQKLLKS